MEIPTPLANADAFQKVPARGHLLRNNVVRQFAVVPETSPLQESVPRRILHGFSCTEENLDFMETVCPVCFFLCPGFEDTTFYDQKIAFQTDFPTVD